MTTPATQLKQNSLFDFPLLKQDLHHPCSSAVATALHLPPVVLLQPRIGLVQGSLFGLRLGAAKR
eukprot:6481105-Amphidinium_carterae.2